MSFLAPLYIAGLAALSLPLLLHLIRRTPRGQQMFSSLMFLSPSPPRLTRRSRLDNLLLLLLRALALTLIALAFARPFLRSMVQLDLSSVRGRRVAVLIDTSASMKRDGIWPNVLKEANKVFDELGPGDQVALLTFNDSAEVIADFQKAPTPKDAKKKAEAIREQLKDLEPTWGGSNIGAALTTAADALDVARDVQQSDTILQVVLISDLQSGAHLQDLQSYEWPARVQVALRIVAPKSPTNASLLLVDDETSAVGQERRIRVVNAVDSEREQFNLQWLNDDGEEVGEPRDVYVPPGQNRVVRMEQPVDSRVSRLELQGDDNPFDNLRFVAPWEQEELTVAYWGDDDPDDSDGLLFYLQRAMVSTPRRKIEVAPFPSEQTRELPADVDLTVVTKPLAIDQRGQLKKHIERGGNSLIVLREAEGADGLSEILNLTELQIDEMSGVDYSMLGEINFRHPVFAAFANPKFSDFTKIRFWKRRRLELTDEANASVLARFDNGDPALVECPLGEGKAFILCAGWHPQDSQLAMSSKFVPLMAGLLEQKRGAAWERNRFLVNDTAVLPDEVETVRTPAGNEHQVEQHAFPRTTEPGIYVARSKDVSLPFAVNLDTLESRTSPLDPGRLEQLGVRLGEDETYEEQVERQRQMQDLELEDRQKIWQWMLLCGFGLLIVETLLAGWLGMKSSRSSE